MRCRNCWPDMADLERQPRGVQASGWSSVQAFRGGTQGHILHEIDDELRERFTWLDTMQTHQRGPGHRPAADQRLIAQRGYVTGHVVRMKAEWKAAVQCVLQAWDSGRPEWPVWKRCNSSDVPVITMQIEPQTPRDFTSRPLMFEDGHARKMDAWSAAGWQTVRSGKAPNPGVLLSAQWA